MSKKGNFLWKEVTENVFSFGLRTRKINSHLVHTLIILYDSNKDLCIPWTKKEAPHQRAAQHCDRPLSLLVGTKALPKRLTKIKVL